MFNDVHPIEYGIVDCDSFQILEHMKMRKTWEDWVKYARLDICIICPAPKCFGFLIGNLAYGHLLFFPIYPVGIAHYTKD